MLGELVKEVVDDVCREYLRSVEHSGFGVWGIGFGVWGLGLTVKGLGLRV